MAPINDGAWNRADELTRAWAATSDVAQLLTADVEFEDRRRLVAEPGHDRLVLAGMSNNASLQHVDRVETIAVRGDLLSVHRMTWHSDDGTDLEWELLTLAEFSDDGHPAREAVEALCSVDWLNVHTVLSRPVEELDSPLLIWQPLPSP